LKTLEAKATTGSDGAGSFALQAGAYCVEFIEPMETKAIGLRYFGPKVPAS
jgi:hypothetical protein